MDFWNRLLGVSSAPRKPTVKPVVDSSSRLTKFRTALLDVDRLCSNKRDLAREETTLAELQKLFEKLAQIIREETRAPIPHYCVQHAAAQNIFVSINRAAAVSFHEGCIHAAVALMAALVDSEEESFLTSKAFAKSLMRLATKVINAGNILLSIETETFILELLFTISAKIRLQPEILPSWFTVSHSIDGGIEKTPTKDDFPLCYILVDRIYHDGRIGDFARTGLLYIFDATGKSPELERWIVDASDVCTLMASGLGALYSQLGRELSTVYPDAVLPAALALSDYTTTHAQATAESAFSERHIAHMTTFLSYLAFWQDILDHCKSDEVKQALLDHFQVLFLQQLLYPCILESSDTDGGSSVAVLSYLTAILESLEHPALTDNIMSYLMATKTSDSVTAPGEPHHTTASATWPQKRQSLLDLTSNGVEALEPTLFSLVDLLHNSLTSTNAQTLFSALRLTTTIITRQGKYAILSMLKADVSHEVMPRRSLGSLNVEIEHYIALARRLHDHNLEAAFSSLTEDVQSLLQCDYSESGAVTEQYWLCTDEGTFLQRLLNLLRTFFSNGIEVNLALTETIMAIARCTEIRLDGWLAIDNTSDSHSQSRAPDTTRPWQTHLDDDEKASFKAVIQLMHKPDWSHLNVPVLYTILTALVAELDTVHGQVPNLDALISGRKNLLQAASTNSTMDIPPSNPSSPAGRRTDSISPVVRRASRSPRPREGRLGVSEPEVSQGSRSPTPASRRLPHISSSSPSPSPARRLEGRAAVTDPVQLFQPPPPEVIPPTTDILIRMISFGHDDTARTASLNHVLTNVIVLQEFVLEVAAVLAVRATVLGEAEIKVQ